MSVFGRVWVTCILHNFHSQGSKNFFFIIDLNNQNDLKHYLLQVISNVRIHTVYCRALGNYGPTFGLHICYPMNYDAYRLSLGIQRSIFLRIFGGNDLSLAQARNYGHIGCSYRTVDHG